MARLSGCAPRPFSADRSSKGNSYCHDGWYVENGQIRNSNQYSSRVAGCIDSTLCQSPSRLPARTSSSLTPDPGNGVSPHYWDCYPGVWQQSWTAHADGRIELTGTGKGATDALTQASASTSDGDVTKLVQLWKCYTGNPNQQFDMYVARGGPDGSKPYF